MRITLEGWNYGEKMIRKNPPINNGEYDSYIKAD